MKPPSLDATLTTQCKTYGWMVNPLFLEVIMSEKDWVAYLSLSQCYTAFKLQHPTAPLDVADTCMGGMGCAYCPFTKTNS